MLEGWRAPDRGVLFVVTGPSGVGKSTLIHEARRIVPDLHFSVSATTRPPREGERDGVDYHFLAPDRFDALVAQGEFLEHARVYDHAYGTLRGPVEAALRDGHSLLLDIDVAGSRQVRASGLPAVHVVILPPDLDTLERRLRERGTDSEAVVRRRMAQVETQLRAVGEFDYMVVNDVLDTAHRCFQGVLFAALCRREVRSGLVNRVHAQLDARGVAHPD
jgi:guanylate kinase